MKQLIVAVAILANINFAKAQALSVAFPENRHLTQSILDSYNNDTRRAYFVTNSDGAAVLLSGKAHARDSSFLRIGIYQSSYLFAALNGKHPEGLQLLHWLLHQGQEQLAKNAIQPLPEKQLKIEQKRLESWNKLYSSAACNGIPSTNVNRSNPRQ